jgi:hypothetical protein
MQKNLGRKYRFFIYLNFRVKKPVSGIRKTDLLKNDTLRSGSAISLMRIRNQCCVSVSESVSKRIQIFFRDPHPYQYPYERFGYGS